MKTLVRIFDFFSSIKLAVILILSLAIILAFGTFYEADYGTAAAHRVIYKSWFMSAELFLLVINLTCAAIDRWPWKRNHIGFVITHAGIITLLLGSYVTQQKGVEGSLPVAIHETADFFSTDETELRIYQNEDRQNEDKPHNRLLVSTDVDFTRRPPISNSNSYLYKLNENDKIEIVRFIEKATKLPAIYKSNNEMAPSALEFRLANDRVNVSQWLGFDSQIPSSYNFGPATVTLISAEKLPAIKELKNQILIILHPKTKKQTFAIYSSRQKEPVLRGPLEVGRDYATGWMGLQFRVEKFFQHASTEFSYVESSSDAPDPVSVIEFQLGQSKKWAELNTPQQIAGPHGNYIVSFSNRRFALGFNLKLKKFKLNTYGGTMMPQSYESTVSIGDSSRQFDQVISMNEPLKYKHFTIYQSGYEQNDHGEPTMSVFSVNYDPGRSIKYSGSILIVLGIIFMFYFKPRWTRQK